MDEMMAEMNKSAGDLSAYQRDLANAQSQKSTVESDLSGAQNQLATAEKDKAAMMEKKRKFENDLGSFKKDIEDMEIAVTRAEQEKTNKDHTIRGMNDEIAHQDSSAWTSQSQK